MERCEHRLQQQRDDGAGNRDSQEPGGTLPQVAGDFARGHELLEGGLCPQQESRSGFGQPDTARGAGEERCADARFQRAHAWLIADGVHRAAPPLCENCGADDAQERLDAVQRALPDCKFCFMA